MGQLTNQEACAMTDINRPARVRLFGQAQADGAYELRDFLQRSVVAFDWIELHSDEDSKREPSIPDLANARLPVVELPDGRRLYTPSVRELADRLGWVTQPRLREYDLSIYGAGPAGLSAAVYAALRRAACRCDRTARDRRTGRIVIAD
jgi:thioredoxin reductase (NADPH)